eukprot:364984-Chlamydomonas_euryale.AAC.5
MHLWASCSESYSTTMSDAWTLLTGSPSAHAALSLFFHTCSRAPRGVEGQASQEVGRPAPLGGAVGWGGRLRLGVEGRAVGWGGHLRLDVGGRAVGWGGHLRPALLRHGAGRYLEAAVGPWQVQCDTGQNRRVSM